MGWGCNADKRDAFLDRHKSSLLSESPNPRATVVAIDGNAASRSQAVALRPAALIAKHILKPVGDAVTDVIICFDNDHVPQVRSTEVHSARQARSTVPAASAETIAAFTDADTTPWEQMFASKDGKVKAFQTIIAALKEIIIRSHDPTGVDRRYVITMPGNVDPDDPKTFVWTYPFGQPNTFRDVLAASFYGEAEAQLAVCVRHSASEAVARSARVPPMALYTIDTDALYQMLGLWHPRLEVVLGTVWQTGDGGIYRSAAKAKAAAKQIRTANKLKRKRDEHVPATVARKYRIVDISKLSESLCSGSAQRMANSQFWQLLAGGCDYNMSGASGFGWFNDTCLRLQTELVIDCDGLHVHKFARVLLANRNKKCQESAVSKFCIMLSRTVFSWRYYQWEIGKGDRRTADPKHDDNTFVAGDATTVTDWLRAVDPGTVLNMGWRPQLVQAAAAHADDAASAAAYCVQQSI